MNRHSSDDIRTARSAAAALRGGRLHVPSSCERDLLSELATAADPLVRAVHEEEEMRSEREAIYAVVDEVKRETTRENRRASRRVSLGGSKRRIVRLRSSNRSHDPRSTFDGWPDAPEAA